MVIGQWRKNEIIKEINALKATKNQKKLILDFFEYIGFDVKKNDDKYFYSFIENKKFSLGELICLIENVRTMFGIYYIQTKEWVEDESYLNKLLIFSDLEKDKQKFITKRKWDDLEKTIFKKLKTNKSEGFELNAISIMLTWYGVPNGTLPKINVDNISIIGDSIFVPNESFSKNKLKFIKITNPKVIDLVLKEKSKGSHFLRGSKFTKREMDYHKEIADKIGDLTLKTIFESGSFYRYKFEKNNKEEVHYKNKQLLFYFKTMADYLYQNQQKRRK